MAAVRGCATRRAGARLEGHPAGWPAKAAIDLSRREWLPRPAPGGSLVVLDTAEAPLPEKEHETDVDDQRHGKKPSQHGTARSHEGCNCDGEHG